MTEIFGQNLAETIFQAAREAQAGFDLTLTKVNEGAINPANLTAGKAKTEEAHSGYGIISIGTRRRGGTVVAIDGAMIAIYAASLPAGVVPEINDRVLIKGRSYCISRVDVDPADAMYQCEAN